jgi:hypothetical protein
MKLSFAHNGKEIIDCNKPQKYLHNIKILPGSKLVSACISSPEHEEIPWRWLL